jgi:hypothetical protein
MGRVWFLRMSRGHPLGGRMRGAVKADLDPGSNGARPSTYRTQLSVLFSAASFDVSFSYFRDTWSGGSAQRLLPYDVHDWQTIRALVIYLPTPADHRVREAKLHQG